MLQKFTCMNTGKPIPHNRVVDCTDQNDRSTYSSVEAFYSCHKTICGHSNIYYERPKELNIYFIIGDEGVCPFMINYGVANGGKVAPGITSTSLAEFP